MESNGAALSSDRGFTNAPLNEEDDIFENAQSKCREQIIPDSPADDNGNHNVARSQFRSHISVFILCFINLINYMDRYTIAGVLTDVKGYYNLDNTDAGLLQTSFIISYMITAPIFGYLGDRYNRKWIMAGGVLFWSATTLAGSFIPSAHFRLFIFLRGLVGVGEASYSTIAPTLIADLFAGSSRTKMLSLFFFAIPLGSGMGYIVGPEVAQALGQWNWSLRISPGLGVLSVIALLLFLKEPVRGESDGSAVLKNTSIIHDIVQVMKIPSFLWVTLGFTCVTFSVGALAWWVPDFIVSAIRMQGIVPDKAKISLIFGVITGFAGIFGVVLGSSSATLYRTINPRADPLICFYAMLTSVPFVYIACVVAAHNVNATYALIFFGVTLLCMNWVLVTDITLYVVIPTRRSIAAAIQITLSHALGDACSPYVIGTISDAICAGRSAPVIVYQSMEYALFLTVFILAIGSICFLVNSFYVVEDKDKCTKIVQKQNEMPQVHLLDPTILFDEPTDDNNENNFIY